MFKSAYIFLIIFSLSALAVTFFIIYLLPMFKRKKMASQEFPESWEKVLTDHFDGYGSLDTEAQNEVRIIVKVFMAEKYLEPDDELKWDEQIMICAHIASKIYQEKHRFLSKLSTIVIGKTLNQGQGLLEVPSIETLKTIDYKRWF